MNFLAEKQPGGFAYQNGTKFQAGIAADTRGKHDPRSYF